MQQRRFVPLCLLAIYTVIQKACPSDVQSTDNSSFQLDAEEHISELVTVSGEAEIIESATNKGPANETTAPQVSSVSSVSLFSLNTDGAPCILLQVDASITFTYKTKSGEDRESSIYLPPDVATGGDCKEEDSATFDLKWKSFVLTWSFAKTPGRERWYVNNVQLKFNTSEKTFQNINKPGHQELSTKSHTMLFPTPVGKSYSCQSETSLELLGGDVSATVFLPGFKLQPFITKKDFGPAYECSPGGSLAFRDETAPIAVGSTLAVVVLVTVTGYGVYRYVKVKKVQYDTME